MNFSKPAESNYGLVPEGEYDVIIKEAYENVHKTNGKPCINLTFTIRNDVDQECKNRNLFLTLWKKREPNADDMQADGYNYNQLKVLLSAARIEQVNFESVADFCRALIGKCVVVSVYHEEYKGKKQERIYGFDILPTDKPDCKHVFKSTNSGTTSAPAQRPPEQFASQLKAADFEELVSDSDVPF